MSVGVWGFGLIALLGVDAGTGVFMLLCLGLVPIMWAAGIGVDVMKRIAAPMIGGIFNSFLLELLLYPAMSFRQWW